MKKIVSIFIGLYILNAFAFYTETIQNQCGIITNDFLAVFTPNTHTCSNGYYLPANTDNCVVCTYGNVCPGGSYTFNEEIDQGISIASYICPNGYFLPAYTEHCESCPDDYTCSGGTFDFDDTQFQGAEKSSTYITRDMTNMCAPNAMHELSAVFTPNEHTCSAGTYLPANIDECTQCPANSYCPGGKLTFNEATPDGIFPCPNNQTSLPGSSSVDQCKTVNLTWVSNGETYTTSTCTINGLIDLPEPPTRPGYTFTGWKLQTNNE